MSCLKANSRGNFRFCYYCYFIVVFLHTCGGKRASHPPTSYLSEIIGTGDFPGGSSGWDSVLPMQGDWVPSLVRELGPTYLVAKKDIFLKFASPSDLSQQSPRQKAFQSPR